MIHSNGSTQFNFSLSETQVKFQLASMTILNCTKLFTDDYFIELTKNALALQEAYSFVV